MWTSAGPGVQVGGERHDRRRAQLLPGRGHRRAGAAGAEDALGDQAEPEPRRRPQGARGARAVRQGGAGGRRYTDRAAGFVIGLDNCSV